MLGLKQFHSKYEIVFIRSEYRYFFATILLVNIPGILYYYFVARVFFLKIQTSKKKKIQSFSLCITITECYHSH